MVHNFSEKQTHDTKHCNNSATEQVLRLTWWTLRRLNPADPPTDAPPVSHYKAMELTKHLTAALAQRKGNLGESLALNISSLRCRFSFYEQQLGFRGYIVLVGVVQRDQNRWNEHDTCDGHFQYKNTQSIWLCFRVERSAYALPGLLWLSFVGPAALLAAPFKSICPTP